MNQMQAADRAPTALALTRKETADWSLARVLLALEVDPIAPRGAAFEIECSRAIAQQLGRQPRPGSVLVPAEVLTRDLAVAGSGGYLTSTSTQAGSNFATALQGASVVQRLGVERIGPLRESVALPRASTTPTAIWLAGENAPITDAQPTFGSIGATPKTVATVEVLSGQLMRQLPGPLFDAFVFGELARALAAAVDAAVISGSGAGGQPLGVMNTAGVFSQSGTGLTFAGVAEMVERVELAGLGDPSRGGFAMGPTAGKLLRQRDRAASGGSGSIFAAGRIDGFTAIATKNVPASAVVFADWAQIVLCEWSTLEINVDPFTLFKSGRLQVRALWSVDVVARQPAAVAIAANVT